ncbi:PREDICTED: UPF0705 protein C11orf49 homolog [Amphimedon queenslandica]|uniref:Centriolar satellite-associated tubulin polyglutamylase complex regulator 1 n=1 Tax=Amphimedon queenslandica TaxID=400682 RepID=A0A1X7VMX2_AMPQE|nr:PREDICTED: UPF0705 protein C11orf49 homolog [Amphimedon queenslandica]|eukprot:XP_011409715.1 PREDICTED: UPF0705 protein C11orf49 homolog [Amphimedon queenslandica]
MEYWKEHYLDVYVQDATAQILHASTCNNGRKDWEDKNQPISYLLQYFKSVQSGVHVMCRPYSYITATPHNRQSFIKVVWLGLGGILNLGEAVSQGEMKEEHYHQLLELFCPDFPVSIVNEAMKITCKEDEDSASFVDFLYTLQILFYYQEFLSGCMTAALTPSLGPVVILPAEIAVEGERGDATTDCSIKETSHTKDSLMQSVKSYHQELAEKKIPVPPLSVIEQALQSLEEEEVSRHNQDFKKKLCKSEALSDAIGVLPSRKSK